MNSSAHTPFHFHPNSAFAGVRELRAGFGQIGKLVFIEIVNRSGQDNACLVYDGGRNRVVKHGQNQLGPIAVARRINGMNDDINTSACI